jgi:RNA polymerase sigma factor (sigma-70 family)
MMTDLQLLEQYARGGAGSQEAFAQLAARHADWVYSVATRMVGGDSHLAEDVTQAVFILLAQDAAKLVRKKTPVNGWLFKVAGYSAKHALRSKTRREKHERRAAAMISETVDKPDDAEAIWQQLAPRLDELVGRLRPQDRDALLLRFYQRKSMAEVGEAMGLSEDAAKKRVAAAIERLRALLAQRDVAISAVALGTCLSGPRMTLAAPTQLLAGCGAPLGGAAAESLAIAKGAAQMLFSAKIKLVALSVLAALVPLGIGAGILASTFSNRTQTPAPIAAPIESWQNSFTVEKANLTSRGSNWYFILEPGHRSSFAHGTATLTISVLDETRLIDGVETRAVEKRESDGTQLSEISRSYFAIDKQSSDVYCFGEEVDAYKGGKIVDHRGSWVAGVNGASFGLMVPGAPKPGQRFYEELAPGVAMDRCQIVSSSEVIQTPAGMFSQCLRTAETSPLDSSVGHKWYAPGVGLVKDDEFELVKEDKP